MKEGQSAAAGAATEGWSSGAHGGSSALGDQVADDTSIPDHVDHDAAVATSTLDVSSAANDNAPIPDAPAEASDTLLVEEVEPVPEVAPANDNSPAEPLPATGTE